MPGVNAAWRSAIQRNGGGSAPGFKPSPLGRHGRIDNAPISVRRRTAAPSGALCATLIPFASVCGTASRDGPATGGANLPIATMRTRRPPRAQAWCRHRGHDRGLVSGVIHHKPGPDRAVEMDFSDRGLLSLTRTTKAQTTPPVVDRKAEGRKEDYREASFITAAAPLRGLSASIWQRPRTEWAAEPPGTAGCAIRGWWHDRCRRAQASPSAISARLAACDGGQPARSGRPCSGWRRRTGSSGRAYATCR
ncbi:hypothetical protein SAMN04487779_100426 [Belnapia rosea]|uniref:Uncharacterized protein n=1 Tax=Belnapia rosea TaxID=938405 RepID=A0A1G6RJ87_9PROT|nr:hypothetical protein SAMN04487779_100426 [Belnapia rosea]